jgi:toxin ParE1/3/4
MARKVVWSGTAWADLEQTADFISRDSPYYAAAFVRETRDAARSLARLAERGRMVPELGDPQIRELIVRNYRLIYLVTSKVCEVVGFVHGARDLEALWEHEERPR